MKDLASHQYDKLVKKYFKTVSPEEVIQQISTKRISKNKKENERIKQLEKEILEAKTREERINKTHQKFEAEHGVAWKTNLEANKEVVQKKTCKDLKQTSDGLLFTNKTFRNSSEYRAQMTPEVRKMIAEEQKKAREAEDKIRREKREKRQREIELENKERYKKWMEKQAYEKEVEAKRKAAHEKAEKLFKKYYEPIMAAQYEQEQKDSRLTKKEKKLASRAPFNYEKKVNTQMGKNFRGKSAHNKKIGRASCR